MAMQPGGIEFSEGGVKVLHVLAKSFPELNGYAIRGHELIKSQNNSGLVNPIVLTSPFYPSNDKMSKGVTHDGIRYLRSMPIRDEEMSPWKVKILKMRDSRVVASKILTGGKGGALPAYRKILSQFSRALSYPLRLTFGVIEEKIRMDYFRKRILQEILEFEPEIVHAHTPFKVGIPAMRAALEANKKFVYEVRGLWEESAIARGKYSRFGLRYWRFRMMENKVLKGAELVFCISEGVKGYLIKRGVKEGKITVLHNAAPREYLSFPDNDSNQEIDEMTMGVVSELEEAGISKKIIGYVGNIQSYEGIETLVDSVKQMVSEGKMVHLAIISNEEDTSGVSSYCEQSGIGEHCTVIGPIRRELIPRIYSCFDVNVIPRLIQSKMARLVTPLKPLEALAMGVPLVISDSPAIREIVSEERGTFFESGNSVNLKNKIEMILSDDELRSSRVEEGRKWVSEMATWDHRARETVEEYQKILRSGAIN